MNEEREAVWSERENGWVELEDQKDYILEEDREVVNHYIEELQKRIRQLKYEIANLHGRNETWEKAWRIWNGEKH